MRIMDESGWFMRINFDHWIKFVLSTLSNYVLIVSIYLYECWLTNHPLFATNAILLDGMVFLPSHMLDIHQLGMPGRILFYI